MKVLVLGASGMLGHRVYLQFRSQNIETKALARRAFSQLEKYKVFRKEDFIENVDLTVPEKYLKVFDREKPDVIVNCAGATTRKLGGHSTADIVALNGELPHRINEWCVSNDSKLIHISTDCVFKGTHAPYSEQSAIEAQDLYGMSKAIGEVKDSTHTLTIRTSIVGLELEGKTELLEWIIAQKNKEARGFKNVIYSGVTTVYLAQLIAKLVTTRADLSGLYQVSSDPISKFDLIHLVNDILELNIKLTQDSQVKSDKTLLHDHFVNETQLQVPSWTEQIKEIKNIYLKEKQKVRDLS